MRYFFKLNWKIIQTLSIFYALFVCSFTCLLAQENANTSNLGTVNEKFSISNSGGNLQSKLSNVLLKNLQIYEAQKKNLVDLETFTLNGKNKELVSTINMDLLKTLNKNIKESNVFLEKTARYCRYMYEKIEKLPIPDDEKLRIECRVDELKTAAEKFSLLINSSVEKNNTESCNVLEINDELGVVLLPKGFLDGIRVGRHFTIPEANNAQINIISVHQFISAAVVVKGELKNIAPGMLVKAPQ